MLFYRLPQEIEAEPEMLERQDESQMPLVDNTLEDKITNREFETNGETSFDKLPAKAKELLMFQNRLRSRFLESSSKKQQKQYYQFDKNRGKHHGISIRPSQNHRERLGVYKSNILSSKKRFLLTKNKHPWMMQHTMRMF